MASLGTETDRLFRTRSGGDYWVNDFDHELRTLVRRVRSVYRGLLTYDMHYSAITDDWFEPGSRYLWEDLDLDVVGVSAWFPLTDTPPEAVMSVGRLQQAPGVGCGVSMFATSRLAGSYEVTTAATKDGDAGLHEVVPRRCDELRGHDELRHGTISDCGLHVRPADGRRRGRVPVARRNRLTGDEARQRARLHKKLDRAVAAHQRKHYAGGREIVDTLIAMAPKNAEWGEPGSVERMRYVLQRIRADNRSVHLTPSRREQAREAADVIREVTEAYWAAECEAAVKSVLYRQYGGEPVGEQIIARFEAEATAAPFWLDVEKWQLKHAIGARVLRGLLDQGWDVRGDLYSIEQRIRDVCETRLRDHREAAARRAGWPPPSAYPASPIQSAYPATPTPAAPIKSPRTQRSGFIPNLEKEFARLEALKRARTPPPQPAMEPPPVRAPPVPSEPPVRPGPLPETEARSWERSRGR